ncbi:hypothetical protein ID866_1858 [Astraeus odoratus]|nr:hypothetical protein ID866_1858 [Astraeus odoratus]
MTAVSAADLRSALSLPASAQGPSQPRKSQTHGPKKPDGISRELYALIGPSAPSLAANLAKPRLKQKPNFGARGIVKWEWKPFRNHARSDSLQLCHWAKANEPDTEYSFAKYNVQLTRYTYSEEEYTGLLDDKEWSKEETDYLFNIVHEYDLRWYVIHDRYDFPKGLKLYKDLKDRYYSCCRKLIRSRPWSGDEASKSQLLNSYQFDKEREKMRKNYIASLEERTPEEIAEEEALFIELKRLEQNERKFRKERDELLRTLLGIDSGLPDIVAEEEGPTALSADNLKKKKKGAADTEGPLTPTNIIALGAPAPKRMQSIKSGVYDEKHCIMRVEPPVTNTTKTTHVPVHLRSFKLPVPKATIAPKVSQALAEVGLAHSRLVMPTRENCAKFESVLEATTALIETKKIVDKVEQDIRVLKARLGLRESEGADGEGKESTAMDVDEAKDDPGTVREVEVEGRAQSVVSTKSGRSRKQVCTSTPALRLNWMELCSRVVRCQYLRSIHLHLLGWAQKDKKGVELRGSLVYEHVFTHSGIDSDMSATNPRFVHP